MRSLGVGGCVKVRAIFGPRQVRGKRAQEKISDIIFMNNPKTYQQLVWAEKRIPRIMLICHFLFIIHLTTQASRDEIAL